MPVNPLQSSERAHAQALPSTHTVPAPDTLFIVPTAPGRIASVAPDATVTSESPGTFGWAASSSLSEWTPS